MTDGTQAAAARPLGQGGALDCLVAEEVPVSLTCNGMPHAVLMATPLDLEDLARGFCLTDGICGRGDILSVTAAPAADGFTVDTRLAPHGFSRFLHRRQARPPRSYTSCGVCGTENVADLPTAAPVAGTARIPAKAIPAALAALHSHQPLNRSTGATHAAAFARPDGSILAAREDVGRHNALDKLIGALAGEEPGFCLVTSRCSYEMVQKAAAAGFQVLTAISAPTALAIREAERLNLTLVALARADRQLVYAHGWRVE